MNAANDEIEFAQDVVWIIERAVRENIGLDAFENPEGSAEVRVQPIDLGMLLFDLSDAETPA